MTHTAWLDPGINPMRFSTHTTPGSPPPTVPLWHPTDDDLIIERALEILERRMRSKSQGTLGGMEDVSNYLRLRLGALEHEVFGVLFLDSRYRLQHDLILFRGTLDSARVYPREVVKTAMDHHAKAVICYHNHPSGVSDPSDIDMRLTQRLCDSLAIIDIPLIDHVIVTHHETVSLASMARMPYPRRML